VLLAGAGGAGWYFLARTPAATDAEGAAAAPSSATPHYLALQPAFVVNLADAEAARYLQVEIEVMARSSSALDKVSDHMPRVRNALLLLLGSRRVSDLASREQKEKLQADVLAEIQAVMAAETGKPQIEAVYFNSFVMQ
jgi:flagellar protein FliL